jgi:hypothetical protein
MVSAFDNWKTFNEKAIPFLEGKDPEYIKLVRQTIPEQLAYLEGFFLKKTSIEVLESRPGYDVILELKEDITQTKTLYYQTPIQYLPLKKEYTDELLRIRFIKRCTDNDSALTLFVSKPHSTDFRYYIDYRHRNQQLKEFLIPVSDLIETIYYIKDARHLFKFDIIKAFNRLLISVNSRPLTAFKNRFGTFRWKVLPFDLKVGPG